MQSRGKPSLAALANLWRTCGGLGLLPDSQRVMQDNSLQLNLIGISSHNDSDEIIQKRIQMWKKVVCSFAGC